MFEKLSAKFERHHLQRTMKGKMEQAERAVLETLEKHLEKKGKQLSGKNRKKRVPLIAAGVAVLAGGGLFWQCHSAKAKMASAKTESKDSHSHRGNPDFGTDFLWHHFPKKIPIPYFSGGGNRADGRF